MLDEDYGDITDPLEGRDVNVVCSKNPGQQWAMTEVTPRGKETKLSKDSKQAKEWMSKLPNLEDIFQLKSYDELSKIINDWLADDEDENGDTTTGTERGTTDNVVKTTKEKSGFSGSLDDAFADLME